MDFISDLIHLILTNKLFAAFTVCTVAGVMVLVFGMFIYLWNPFSFPYMDIPVDVTGKRNVIREDIIDSVLLDQDMIQKINGHETYIRSWKSWCKERINRSLFKARRKKQLLEKIPQKDKVYRFYLYRNRKKYTYHGDHRYTYDYTRQFPAGQFSASAGELKLRYRKLKQLGFKGTMGEIERKKQRSLMTESLRKQIMKRDDYTCQICGKYMPDGKGIHIDHIIPVIKGGKTTPDNLQVLCADCNRKKSDKD